MKKNSTPFKNMLTVVLLLVLSTLTANRSSAQITTLGDPTKYVYGLSDNGQIFEINTSNGATNKTIKDATYSGNAPSGPNGLGYNPVNRKFYYFKNNTASSTQEFVSFDPATGVVAALAKSTITSKTVTGAVSNDGSGYYTLTEYGELNYYNIATNKWKVITTDLVDNYNTDIDSLVFEWSNGDIAFDGAGNLWIVVSYSAKYAVYKIAGPPPTSSVSVLSAVRIIAPTTSTPHNSPITGVGFGPDGNIFMSTLENKLYSFQNNTSLSFVANLPEATEGSDLTSQNFPGGAVLPVTWVSVQASLENNSKVTLNWNVFEYDNQGFYVQHSQDGLTWNDVDFIKSRNIPQSEESYSYSYIAALYGKQYYRIRQVDIDGKESFSPVKALTFKNSNSTVAIWPNPAKNSLNINNNSGNDETAIRVQFYDLSGRLSIDRKLVGGTNVIDISSLSRGVYVVSTTTSAGKISSLKIVKQ